jgi:hypothetical protein
VPTVPAQQEGALGVKQILIFSHAGKSHDSKVVLDNVVGWILEYDRGYAYRCHPHASETSRGLIAS